MLCFVKLVSPVTLCNRFQTKAKLILLQKKHEDAAREALGSVGLPELAGGDRVVLLPRYAAAGAA